jgi:hypothetical protein
VIDAGHLNFARRCLLYFAENGVISWRRYNWLMKSVVWHERRVSGCEGKDRFETYDLASKVARRPRRNGEVLRVYPCKICSGYHLTGTDSHKDRMARQRLRELREADDEGLADA